MSQSRPQGQESARDEAGGKPTAEDIGHDANVNQVGDQPVPASHDENRRQDAVVENERAAAASAPEGRRDGTVTGRPNSDRPDEADEDDGQDARGGRPA